MNHKIVYNVFYQLNFSTQEHNNNFVFFFFLLQEIIFLYFLYIYKIIYILYNLEILVKNSILQFDSQKFIKYLCMGFYLITLTL